MTIPLVGGRRYPLGRIDNPMSLRAASLLHLLDLKRAGFRARHGELRIPPGDCARTYFPARGDDRYIAGSVAADCMEG